MVELRRLCVFCGSSAGTRPEYAAAASEFGSSLARQGIGVVFGGGSVGLMGTLADAALAARGEVIGVIPHALAAKELAHPAVTTMHVVHTMHERKAMMAELADGFVALPGGVGTFEEWFEAVTWLQLGIHRKPVGLLNVAGYYDPLVAMLQRSVEAGFVRPVHHAGLVIARTGAELLSSLLAWQPRHQERWVMPSES